MTYSEIKNNEATNVWKPTLLELKQEVLDDHPEIGHMASEYQGYANELSKLGFEISENNIKMMAVIQFQESMGNQGAIGGFRNILEEVGSSKLGHFIPFVDKPKTLGKMQISIDVFKNILKDPTRKSLLPLSGNKTVLEDINLIISKYVPDAPSISNVDELSYDQVKRLLKNNAISFYITSLTLKENTSNLESMARRAVSYDSEDVLYSAHFLQNHTAPALYSAVLIQNILQMALLPKYDIQIDTTKPITLDGKFNEDIEVIVEALKQKGVELELGISKSGYITSINGQKIIDKKGVQIDYLESFFSCDDQQHYYPLLSHTFVEENSGWLRDHYNYAYRKYLENNPETRKKRFESTLPSETERSLKTRTLEGVTYASNPSQVGLSRDGEHKKPAGGSLDCVTALQYMMTPLDTIPKEFSYLGQSELNTYSALSAQADSLEFHDIFSDNLKAGSKVAMMTPKRYQSNEYFRVVSGLKAGMIVGFGHEYKESLGAKMLPISFPQGQTKNVACSMSHGGIVTRISSNQVWIAMASKQNNGVVELPLFGSGGVYELYLTDAFDKDETAPKKYVYFGELDSERLERERKERVDQMQSIEMNYQNGFPSMVLDGYTPYHKQGEHMTNFCVEIARKNAEKILYGKKRHILYGDAKTIIGHLDTLPVFDSQTDQASDVGSEWVGQTVNYGPQERSDGTSTDIHFQKCQADQIIDHSVYTEQVLPNLEAIKQQCSDSGTPVVVDCYIATKHGHKVILTRGSKGGVEDRYVIDTLRGGSSVSAGANGINLASEYFSNPDGFYMGNEDAYHTLYIRKDPVGVRSQLRLPQTQELPAEELIGQDDSKSLDEDLTEEQEQEGSTQEEVSSEEVTHQDEGGA